MRDAHSESIPSTRLLLLLLLFMVCSFLLASRRCCVASSFPATDCLPVMDAPRLAKLGKITRYALVFEDDDGPWFPHFCFHFCFWTDTERRPSPAVAPLCCRRIHFHILVGSDGKMEPTSLEIR